MRFTRTAVLVASLIGVAACQDIETRRERDPMGMEGGGQRDGSDQPTARAPSTPSTPSTTAPPTTTPPSTTGQQTTARNTTLASVQNVDLSDAELVGLLAALDKNHQDLAREGERISDNPRVDELARQITSGHQDFQQRLDGALGSTRIEAAESDTKKQYQSYFDQQKSQLEGLSGADFDKKFAQTAIDLHQQELAIIDYNLNRIDDVALRTFVQQERANLNQHLTRVKDLQKNLGSATGGT